MSDFDEYDFDEYRVSYVQALTDFAEWIVSLDDDDPDSPGRRDRQTVNLTQIINRAKAALDG